MATNQTTKVRYFALGLIICLLAVPHFFEVFVPGDIKQPQMWVYVRTAIVSGSLTVLLVGAVGGFAFAKNVLSPSRTFGAALILGASISSVMVTDIVSGASLGVIALSSLSIGFFVCWATAELLGKNPELANVG